MSIRVRGQEAEQRERDRLNMILEDNKRKIEGARKKQV